MTDIAIVGMDCRFPGAPDCDSLWRMLLDGEDGITEVPPDRWRAADYHDPEGGPGKTNTSNGGFLADADAFDHEFFAITPREAALMDPQQRLLLQAAWRALEDATLDPRSVAGSNTGVFVGVMANEWANLHMTEFAAITPQHGSGNGYFMTANRISYHLDLQGPSMAIDTACSSSLVAVHAACEALRDGACEQCLAGGVNLMLTPALGIFYSQAGLSAPDGRCKPFSANADGMGRGEGVALLVLRRLSDARAAGLPVYAVIEGGAVNSDGRSNGIIAPNRWAQKQVVAAACGRAGVEPEQISFIEAHGTGTELGDMIEAKALADVQRGGRETPCAIGSIKGNLGHTEGAAGVAALIKVALSLHSRVVPRSLYAEEENAQLRLAESGLRLLAEPLALPGGTVHAGVSSFGLGGTNAHLVLRSPPEVAEPPATGGGGILTVSAPNADALRTAAAQLADDVAAQPAERLAQVCWSSNRIKASGRHRIAVAASDRDEAVAALRGVATDDGALSAVSGRAGEVVVGWLFSGDDAAYPGMARALCERFSAYRDAVSEVDEALAPHLGRSVRDLLLGAHGLPAEAVRPAVFAQQWALGRVLRDAGIEPEWLLGHGAGEYAVAAHAGVLDLADASRLVACDDVGAVAAELTCRAPRIPVYSTLRGRLLGVDERMDAGYWTEHAGATVRFREALGAALDTEPTHLIEVGPRATLAPLVSGTGPDSGPPVLVPCPGPEATGLELAEVVAALHRQGLDPAWDVLYEPGQRVRRRLSGYRFATHNRSWVQQGRAERSGAAGSSVPPTPPQEETNVDQAIALFREQAAVLAALASSGASAAPPPGPTATGPALEPRAEPTIDPDFVGASLLAAIAEVSGFPEDALGPEQTLTGDLGFDSIMVAELFDRMTHTFPQLMTIDVSDVSAESTIGELSAQLGARLGAIARPQASAQPRPEASGQPRPEAGAQPRPEDYVADRFPEVVELDSRIKSGSALGLRNPYFLVNDGVTRDTSIIEGAEVVNYSSYNYLGLSGHPAVTAAVQDAVARYGSSCSSSRLLSGEKPVHQELEAELAALLGSDDAIVMSSGHATFVGVIGHLVGPGDLVIHDELAHNSIVQGGELSGATRRPFAHNDAAALDRFLSAARSQYRRVLIVIEGAYSQDGDIGEVAAVVAVKKRHHAVLMVDEAHSLGVLGATGAGVGEHFDVDRGDVELWAGTVSKSLASCGGYVAGSQPLIQYLKYTTPGFIFSAGITPPNAAAALAALHQMRAEPERLEALAGNSALFLKLATEAGIDTGDSAGTPIVPCIVGDSLKTLRLSNALLARGINVNPILYPAVPEELARLRFFLTSCHTEAQIRATVEALSEELTRVHGAG